MSVGFGFSVGDFIAALELVATVVDALRESGEASKRYRELIRQLHTLETVLIRFKRLELDDSQHGEYVALQQAASQCQRAIDDFWTKIKKYQPALAVSGTSSRLKEGWMKIRWAVCRKEDINAFKADVSAHTESIQLLLTTIQIGIEQGKQVIATTSRILQMNVQIFRVVLNIQNFITHIPAQVERQQPVYLTDALGRHSPFHLEFIRSAEALTAVLQANFSKTGQARQKIGRGEFVIQNSLTKRDVNIHDDWDKCFYPGQRVEMSVIFQRRWQTGSSCPGCGMICEGSTESDVRCSRCDMTFRRIITIEEHPEEEPVDPFTIGAVSECAYSFGDTTSTQDLLKLTDGSPMASAFHLRSTTFEPQALQAFQPSRSMRRRKRDRENASGNENLEIDIHEENIRRVRIQTVSRGYTKKFAALFAYFEEGGKPEPASCWGFRTREDESCLIIDFEDSESSALCDTITHQNYKLGGLFHTDLVEADSITEHEEESHLQITWMEEDDVQLYLRFKTKNGRDAIWNFIVSAQLNWQLRNGQLSQNRTPSPMQTKVRQSRFQTRRNGVLSAALKKRDKELSRIWKCPVQSCRYHEYGWPTEKELNRHHEDTHSLGPTYYECHFKPCPYKSKRESNCKQHMEKAHGWEYVRSKNNGRNHTRGDSSIDFNASAITSHGVNISATPQATSYCTLSSHADTGDFLAFEDFGVVTEVSFKGTRMLDQRSQSNVPEYNPTSDMNMPVPHDDQLDYSPQNFELTDSFYQEDKTVAGTRPVLYSGYTKEFDHPHSNDHDSIPSHTSLGDRSHAPPLFVFQAPYPELSQDFSCDGFDTGLDVTFSADSNFDTFGVDNAMSVSYSSPQRPQLQENGNSPRLDQAEPQSLAVGSSTLRRGRSKSDISQMPASYSIFGHPPSYGIPGPYTDGYPSMTVPQSADIYSAIQGSALGNASIVGKRARNTLSARQSRQKKARHYENQKGDIMDLASDATKLEFWNSMSTSDQIHGLGVNEQMDTTMSMEVSEKSWDRRQVEDGLPDQKIVKEH